MRVRRAIYQARDGPRTARGSGRARRFESSRRRVRDRWRFERRGLFVFFKTAARGMIHGRGKPLRSITVSEARGTRRPGSHSRVAGSSSAISVATSRVGTVADRVTESSIEAVLIKHTNVPCQRRVIETVQAGGQQHSTRPEPTPSTEGTHHQQPPRPPRPPRHLLHALARLAARRALAPSPAPRPRQGSRTAQESRSEVSRIWTK